METIKLYYEDSFMKEFEARVLSCEPQKDRFAVILDQTAFYPEGGGQACDLGKLGSVSVLDVREQDGSIIHYCDAPAINSFEFICIIYNKTTNSVIYSKFNIRIGFVI